MYTSGALSFLVYYNNIVKVTAATIVEEMISVNLEDPLQLNLQKYLTYDEITSLRARIEKLPFKSACFLLELGFSPSVTEVIITYFGKTNDIINRVQNDPYVLLDIEGLSFSKIDKIALSYFNIDKKAPIRQKAILVHLLKESCNKGGHLYIGKGEFIHFLKKEDVYDDSLFNKYMSELMAEKKIFNDSNRLYTRINLISEAISSKIIAEIIKNESVPVSFSGYNNSDIDFFIKKYEDAQTANIVNGKWKKLEWQDDEFKLSKEQKEVINLLFKKRFFIVTGLPGTGKSLTVRALVDICVNHKLNLNLMCPTGIAAKKLSEMCDYEAKTIHKSLEYTGVAWLKNEDCPLTSDVIIIDEFSMVDQYVFYRLLKALPKEKDFTLILVGDYAQLPSVAPGNVLSELIKTKKIPHINLTKIFRQEEASDIIINAHVINKGSGELVNKRGDFIIQPIEEHGKILSTIMQLVEKTKDKQVQVLSPTYKGILGVVNLNNVLQNLLNPAHPHPKHFESDPYDFRIGDRVMIIKNDYQNDVYNGEHGILSDINIYSKKVEIYINNRTISYYFSDARNFIVLDYARTIHKAQGQEYDYVILPFVDEFTIQLQRNLLYTAITRAKNKVIILGHTKAFLKAIKNNDTSRRNTVFAERILAEFV